MATSRRTTRTTSPPPATRYEWRDKPITIKNARQANPQRIGEALAAIATSNNGRLTPQAAREAARSSRHPLHRHLEWNDHVAAESFRLDQCREIIRSLRAIELTDDRREVRGQAFVSINEGGRNGISYRPLSAIIDNASLQIRVMEQAERDLAAFQRRYDALLHDVCDLVLQLRETVAERRAAAQRSLNPPPQ